MIEFEWGDDKAESNRKKHGVAFEEAQTIFDDPYVLIQADSEHSITEERAQAIGMSEKFRVLFVVFLELHEDHYRIISARKADRKERQAYESRRANAQKR